MKKLTFLLLWLMSVLPCSAEIIIVDNDILKKTDGCVTTGQPDKNDWITTCEAQQQIYPFVIETIDYVNSLKNKDSQ